MSPPKRLRGQWWLTAGAFTLGAAAVVAATTARFSARTAATWLVAAALPLGYVLWFLQSSLAQNRPPAGAAVSDGGFTVGPTLGLANGITVVRGGLFAGLTGFVLVVPPTGSPWRWLPVAAYGLGAGLDWVDGLVARNAGRRTVLGEKLDMAFDTLGFLVAPLVGVAWGRIPVWYLSLSAARYLFKFGCWQRRRRGLAVGELPPSRLRRPLAGVQMAFITVALLPLVPPAVVRPAAAVVVVPSLALFLRDYLAVSRAPDKETGDTGRTSEENNYQNGSPTEDRHE